MQLSRSATNTSCAGERLGSADAGIPHLDDTFDVINPRHAYGAAGFEHDDKGALPAVPRIPNEPAYGVQAGKPDFGGLAKGVWNVPYIVNLQTDAHDENGCRFIQIPFSGDAG